MSSRAFIQLICFFCLSIIPLLSYSYENINHQSVMMSIADRQLMIDKSSYVLAKKQFIDLKIAKSHQLALLQDKGITTQVLKHTQMDVIAAQAAVEGANIALTDAKEAKEDTDTTIHHLEKKLQELILLSKGNQWQEDKIISVEANLEYLKRLQTLQHERIDTLTAIKSLTLQRMQCENAWQQHLQILNAEQQQDRQHNKLSEKLASLQQQQQSWLQRLSFLTQGLQTLLSQGATDDSYLKKLHLKILECEENVALIKLKSYLVQVQNRLDNLQELNKTQKTSNQLTDLVDYVVNINTQLFSTQSFIKSKIQFLTMKKNELTSDRQKQILSFQDAYSYSKMLTDLIADYSQELNKINKLENKADYYQHEFKHQLQHHLSERQKFPSDWSGWLALSQRILEIPYLLMNAFKNFSLTAVDKFKTLGTHIQCLYLIAGSLLAAGWYYLRHYLLSLELEVKDNKRFSTNIVYVLIELGRRNVGSLLIFVSFIIVLFSLNMTSFLFISLLLVYLCFKISLNVAKLTLLEGTLDFSGKDVKLYSRLRSSLILGLFLSSLTVVAHQLPVAYEAKTLVNRLFMVFILVIALQLFRIRLIIPLILEAIIHFPRRYFYRVLKLLSLLIPFTLVFNAVIGLLGYVELAWVMAKYQVIFIILLTSYLIIRGLFIDAMELCSEFLIRHLKQGWLWTEAILKPLDRILRIILFILSGLFLLHLYRLDNNQYFINSVKHFLYLKLFTIGGNSISALLLCELFIIGSLIKWLAHWSREFSYRWLYAKSKDVGVRNSLSIFTQYASVMVSVLIGLKFLGIDLRGFTVIAAAFAAGIGFGMRDLIVNFFSGILLLIERPFRTGDIITIGNYEGEVIVTGMRSMTIRTWDHMEVIVPNADMFTKPFMNWTHHDNIVRTVITLKIHREDDPHKVQWLILELLRNHPAVAKDPIAEVILHEINDSLIDMHVRYYMLLTNKCTRTGVKSEVLFAIWDCFKEHNIRAPHPQYDLVIKNKQQSQFETAAELEF